MTNHTVETHSGRCVDLVNPKAESICITDIAWSLSRQARFNGHTKGEHPYSVAQHSIYVAEQVLIATQDRRAAQYALLHDAHEAYMGDIVSPLKWLPRLSHIVGDVERALQHAIHEAFGLNPPSERVRAIIKLYDMQALAIEAYHLLPSRGANWPLPPVDHELMNEFDGPVLSITAYHRFISMWERWL